VSSPPRVAFVSAPARLRFRRIFFARRFDFSPFVRDLSGGGADHTSSPPKTVDDTSLATPFLLS